MNPGLSVHDEDRVATLTSRERQVLTQLAEGFMVKEIAHNLSISVSTADSHVMHIYKKLGVKKAVLAVRVAIRCGVTLLMEPSARASRLAFGGA
jgi:DNA-binding NarL/FixJ family response regulator